MNEKIKSNYLKIFVLSSSSFGAVMWEYIALLGYPNAVIAGIQAGLVFGIAVTAFAALMARRSDTVKKELFGDKTVVLSGGANHLKSIEAVGGWLFLTEDDFYFKSHKFNVQVHELKIPLSQIKSVEKFNRPFFIPNGIKIATSSGDERFTVFNRDRWVNEINSSISKVI